MSAPIAQSCMYSLSSSHHTFEAVPFPVPEKLDLHPPCLSYQSRHDESRGSLCRIRVQSTRILYACILLRTINCQPPNCPPRRGADERPKPPVTVCLAADRQPRACSLHNSWGVETILYGICGPQRLPRLVYIYSRADSSSLAACSSIYCFRCRHLDILRTTLLLLVSWHFSQIRMACMIRSARSDMPSLSDL